MRGFISGAISGLAWGLIVSAAGVPLWVGFSCWLIGTINGVVITWRG